MNKKLLVPNMEYERECWVLPNKLRFITQSVEKRNIKYTKEVYRSHHDQKYHDKRKTKSDTVSEY